jgi:tRNA-Thr(GGU) m(6)t(6)A37 methyltransferase TsaA
MNRTTEDVDVEAVACDPVGVVHTPFDRPEDAPRQGMRAAARGELLIDPAYEEGLGGVAAGDRLEVVWYADRADRSVLTVDGHGETESRGVFASRSQDRPTPVCTTRCRVLSVEGTRLLLEGVDMLDGTPVLDLKTPLEYDG